MTLAFNCIATGIGSMPITDPDKAVELSLRYLPEVPIWPQLPLKDIREQFCEQYSEALPGIVLDSAKKRFYFDTSKDLTPDLERFFERYIAKDYEFFKLSEAYASGFYALLRALKKGLPSGVRFLKGHVTGPLTFGITVKDQTGKDILYNEMLFDAITKGLAMKAAWQVRTLKQFGVPVVIFVDDPAMSALGSAFYAIPSETITEKLNEVIDAIHEQGGIAGIHCCGNADWPMLFKTEVDIVNFDAFGYREKVLLYPGDIKTFYARGGALAWGIVPTSEFTGKDTADGLIVKLDESMKQLEAAGIDRRVILKQCLLTPSCGMGSLTPDKAEAILKLLREVSDKMQLLIAK
jgi:methionine synthase II (cobalamin-independent)